MLLASGVNYGFVRTIPHMCGITIGCSVMLMATGAGLGQVFVAFPITHTVLRVVGTAYLLWLAWKIARSQPPSGNTAGTQPMTFMQAALFQWVNPKAWMMAMGALTTYLPAGSGWQSLGLMAAVLMAVNVPSIGVWAGGGVVLRQWLHNPRLVRIFNVSMALLLVLSLYPILAEVSPER